jgi:hypothetical protein
MQLTELFLILLLVLIGWFWFDSSRVGELARRTGFTLCQQHKLQFLDDTVHLSKLYLGKNTYGQLKILRRYRFEFTNNEYRRYNGEITFAGMQLIKTYMDAYPLDTQQDNNS